MRLVIIIICHDKIQSMSHLSCAYPICYHAKSLHTISFIFMPFYATPTHLFFDCFHKSMVVKKHVFWSQTPMFKPQSYYLLAVWPFTSYLTFLRFSSFICIMEILLVPLSLHWRLNIKHLKEDLHMVSTQRVLAVIIIASKLIHIS